MENKIFGILTIGLVTVLYSFAFRNYKMKRYQQSIMLIMLGGFLLRLFTSCDLFLHAWDERHHALVAKNLIDNPWKPMLYTTPLLEYDFKHWTNNHVWVHKQPIPLYTMAMSMWIFGKNVIALRLPSIILSTIAILSTYKIGKLVSSIRVGLIAAFLFSINGLIIEQTAGRVATDHIDVFFFSLVTIAVYFLLKSTKTNSTSSFILGSILTGFAILCKWLPALIVLPVWIIFSYKKEILKTIIMKVGVFLSIVLVIVLPWQLYILHNFPQEAAWEYAYNKKHIFETLGTHGEPFYYHINRMRIIFGELIYLPLIWFIYRSIKELKKGRLAKFALFIWIIIPYVFFSIAHTKMQGYILFCAPAIFIMTGMFFEAFRNYKIKIPYIKPLVLFILIALPIRYSIERIKPFSDIQRQHGWISEIKKIENQNQDKKIVIFNTGHAIETMFHTDMIAYQVLPDTAIIQSIHEEGYTIFIDDNEIIPQELLKLDFVEYVSISGDQNNRKIK